MSALCCLAGLWHGFERPNPSWILRNAIEPRAVETRSAATLFYLRQDLRSRWIARIMLPLQTVPDDLTRERVAVFPPESGLFIHAPGCLSSYTSLCMYACVCTWMSACVCVYDKCVCACLLSNKRMLNLSAHRQPDGKLTHGHTAGRLTCKYGKG